MSAPNIIPFYQVDAFTDKVFKGNPAGVCPLNEWLEDSQLQAIANENNLSETAFFVKKDDDFELRWFTPDVEIDLCGHATLATAYTLFYHLEYSKESIRFHTKSGVLTVKKKDKKLSMDFPSRPPEKADPPEGLIEGMGAKPKEVLKSRDYLLRYNNEEEVLALSPSFELLKKVDCVGIIATAKGNQSDFVSRFFAPRVGVNEDPVTGSAHSTLIPYWSKELDKTTLHAFQISKRRGELFCQLKGDRVIISGYAKTYLQGFIELP